MANLLDDAASIVTVVRGLVSLALAVTAWLAVDWRRVYGMFRLGTQMERLQDEWHTLFHGVFPARYRHLNPATIARVEGAIAGCVLSLYHRSTSSHSHSI
jgi:hypothetical protein